MEAPPRAVGRFPQPFQGICVKVSELLSEEPRVSRLFCRGKAESDARDDIKKLFDTNVLFKALDPSSFDPLMDKLNKCVVGFKEALVVWIFLQAVYPCEKANPPAIFFTYDTLFTCMRFVNGERVKAFATQFFQETIFDCRILTEFLSEVVPITHFSEEHYAFLFSNGLMELVTKMRLLPKHFEQPGFALGHLQRLRLTSKNPTDRLEKFRKIYIREQDAQDDLYLQALKALPFDYGECILLLEDSWHKPAVEITTTDAKAQCILLARARKQGIPAPRYLEKLLDLLTPRDPLFVLQWLAEENLTDDPHTKTALELCPPDQLWDVCRIPAFKANPLLFEFFIAQGEEFCRLWHWVSILNDTVIPFGLEVRKGILFPHERISFYLWLAHDVDLSQDFGLMIYFADFPLFWRTICLKDSSKNGWEEDPHFLKKVATVWPELVLEEHQKPSFPQDWLTLKTTLDHAIYHHHFPERMNAPKVPVTCLTEAEDLEVAKENLIILNLVPPSVATVREHLDPFIQWVAALPDDSGDNNPTDRDRIDTCLQALRILTPCLDDQCTTSHLFSEHFIVLIQSTMTSLRRILEPHSCYRFLVQLAQFSEKNRALMGLVGGELQPVVDLAWTRVDTFGLMGQLRGSLEQLLQVNPKWFILGVDQKPLPLCLTTIQNRNAEGKPRLISVKRVRAANQPPDALGATQVGQKRKWEEDAPREQDAPVEITPWPLQNYLPHPS